MDTDLEIGSCKCHSRPVNSTKHEREHIEWREQEIEMEEEVQERGHEKGREKAKISGTLYFLPPLRLDTWGNKPNN